MTDHSSAVEAGWCTLRSALDVGCGLGYSAQALSASGFDVTAFDVSMAAIAICPWRAPRSKEPILRHCVAFPR